MNKIILTSILILSFVSLTFAQKRVAWISAADTAFYAEKDYYKAFKYYEAALLYDTVDMRIWYQKAEAARLFNDYFDAEYAYNRVARDAAGVQQFPCALAYAGEMQLRLGDYDRAEKTFQRFLAQVNAPEDCKKLANEGLKDAGFAKEKGGLKMKGVKLTPLSININSPYSDFGVFPTEDAMYFSAYSFPLERKKKRDPYRYYARILKSENGAPPVLVTEFNLGDTTLHVGHTTFNRDRSRVYFTICEYEKNGVDIRCDIYYRERADNSSWSNPIPVDEVNNSQFTTTQPSIGWDTKNNRETLYFVSDRPGEGGLDIWQSAIENGRHASPTNLGSVINTDGDDVTPFFHNASQRLFFSSAGHAGYGGYDVFFSVQNETDAWQEPVNQGEQINSSYDDVYYSLDAMGQAAYLSSNRLGSTLFEKIENDSLRFKEACCLDIYSYQTPPCDLKINTFRDCDETGKNGRPLSAVKVEVFDITNGEPGVLLSGKTNEQGNDVGFSPLQPGKIYKIKASKEQFEDAFTILDFTNGDFPCKDGNSQVVDICLVESCPAPLLLTRILDADADTNIVSDLSLRLIDLGENDQLMNSPDFKSAGNLCSSDRLAVYKAFPNERYISPYEPVEIEYDRYYALLATKERYDYALDIIRIPKGSLKGLVCMDTLDLEMSLEQEVAPLSLFFDNDSPHPRTLRTDSDTSYLQIYETYYKKKDYFRSQITAGDVFLRTQRLDNFFEGELKANAERLKPFSDHLFDLLCQGANIDLEINGCASPRFNDPNNVRQRTYNNRLKDRRMDSVIQFFENYQQEENGSKIFEPFLDNQLNIMVVEKKCEVVDPEFTTEELMDMKDRETSIFSTDASRYRRADVTIKFRKETIVGMKNE